MPRSGAVLLEVLVALAILGAAGGSMLGMVADDAEQTRRAYRTGRELREANALLEAVTLWSTADLDRHLGWRRQGRWRMGLERQPGSIYVVRISRDSVGGELLRTWIYRPEGDR